MTSKADRAAYDDSDKGRERLLNQVGGDEVGKPRSRPDSRPATQVGGEEPCLCAQRMAAQYHACHRLPRDSDSNTFSVAALFMRHATSQVANHLPVSRPPRGV